MKLGVADDGRRDNECGCEQLLVTLVLLVRCAVLKVLVALNGI